MEDGEHIARNDRTKMTANGIRKLFPRWNWERKKCAECGKVRLCLTDENTDPYCAQCTADAVNSGELAVCPE